jgi:hypothetical protein
VVLSFRQRIIELVRKGRTPVEYASEDADAFEELVGRLRETEEWSYVEREVDVRVKQDDI